MRIMTVFLSCLFLTASLHAEVAAYEDLKLQDGEVLTYALVLPQGFNPERAYPVLLALPPGMQDRAMVEDALARYWGKAASERGWIVVSPVAPGLTFFQGAEAYLPELMSHIRRYYAIEKGKFHLAGVSMGGSSAFKLALEHPEAFLSISALPGYPRGSEEKLKRLTGIPIRLYGGSRDSDWIASMRESEETLKALGADVELHIFEGEGHLATSLEGGTFMDTLDALRSLTGGP